MSSSLTLHWAQTSIKNGNRFGLQAGHDRDVPARLTFLFIQINEYVHIGLTPQDFAQATVFFSPDRPARRARHIGLILLGMVTVRSFRGHFSPEEHHGVEIPGIYWHFVDVMWIVVYTSVYML